MSANNNTEEQVENQTDDKPDKPVFCYACGDHISYKFTKMLICTECLNDECDEFFKKASAYEKE